MRINFTPLKKVIFAFATIFLPAGCLYAQLSTALVQVIHNAADPELLTVDVYVSDILWADNVQFRQASEFETVIADVPTKIDIAPAASTSSADAIYSTTVTLAPGTKNIIMATGVVGTGFAPNPESKDIAFNLKVFNAAKDISTDPSTVEVNFWHGVTDAPVLNVVTGLGDTLVKSIGYNLNANYDVLNPGIYNIYLTSTYNKEDTLGAFTADLSGYAGKAILIFASGFLNPLQNNDGPAFALYAALPDGEVVALSDIIAGVKASATPFQKLLAYPVPSADLLTLEIENDTPGMVEVELVNMYGNVVEPSSVYLTSGKNLVNLDLSNVANGQYLIKIIGKTRMGTARCAVIK
ncbi:MAG: T9SS type A sorting domain-containing protein [Sporocytophaga sp.]|nr:T9SS type A sorting domain-containing protein [Sporocytophaga sp.]